MNRPILPQSKKNIENLDAQFERDKESFERRASLYRRLQAGPYHHSTQNSILTLWEEGHIVDRGRGRGPEGSRTAPPKAARPLRQVIARST